MLRRCAEGEYDSNREGGVRHLFKLGQYEFEDTMDTEEQFHHYIVERAEGGAATTYEVDRMTMYEFMARFLAGAYELEEYQMEQSPGHNALLDVLEIATARARSGETEFSWEAFDRVENEVMDDEDREDEQE